MKPPVVIGLIVAGVILALVWNSPSGSAEWVQDVVGAIGRFLERLANTIATFVGGLAD
jgi:cell shape-determining protein MreC